MARHAHITGKVEYRVDKTAIIHAPIGKVSFGPEKLLDNAKILIDSVIKAKPVASKPARVLSCAKPPSAPMASDAPNSCA